MSDSKYRYQLVVSSLLIFALRFIKDYSVVHHRWLIQITMPTSRIHFKCSIPVSILILPRYIGVLHIALNIVGNTRMRFPVRFVFLDYLSSEVQTLLNV